MKHLNAWPLLISLGYCVLQGKQESVLELLARADADASNQSERHHVHSSMSETLAEAWKDLNHEMDLRQSLLDQNVAFHESAEQVGIKATVAKYANTSPLLTLWMSWLDE